MSQTAKVQEPSMEEILASIRRIIADDDAGKPKAPEAAAPKRVPLPPPVAAVPSHPVPPPVPRAPAPPPAAANNQDDIDAMLADLDAPPKVAAMPIPPKPAAAPPPDVLDLTEAMTAPTPAPPLGPAPNFRTIDGASDVVFTDPPAPRAELAARAETRQQFTQNATPDQGLISNTTISAVDSAFNSLAYTILGQNARTLEDLVKEMLRPMLKGWLDDNLPGMVERIVRAEIERVSRGRP
jgi:cell pole-organizing protein PopZ